MKRFWQIPAMRTLIVGLALLALSVFFPSLFFGLPVFILAVYDQPKTTYSDTTNQKRVISPSIFMIDPRDTPLLAALGGLNGAREKFKISEDGYKIELLEDELDPLETTANHGTTITTSRTTFTVTDASIFQDGHVILVDSEYMVVKSANLTSNLITVYSRAYGGTNATHATGATITIVGMARLEGDDADFGPIVDITAPYNYTSIFQKGFKVSGTDQAIDVYGYDDPYVYQGQKAIPHLLRLVERMAFHGVRAAGSAAAPRSSGNLGTFITDNAETSVGAIAKADVDNLMEKIYADGGNPDLLVVNPSIARDFKDLIDSSSFVRVGLANEQLGMDPLAKVVTQYGPLGLIMSRHCPLATAYILDSSKVGFYTLRGFDTYPLAKDGDSDKGEVIAEIAFMVANDKAHGKMTGITS